MANQTSFAEEVGLDDAGFERNLRIFREKAPHIGERLAEYTPQSSLFRENGRTVDIDLGEDRFYGIDGTEFVEQQLAQYFGDPTRVLLGDAAGVGLVSPVSVLMLNKLGDTMKQHGVSELQAAPVDFAGVLVIFGIGLGLHIHPLIERTRAKYVIIAEPNLDFIHHSLHGVDWARIFEQCETEGVRLIFLDDTTPEALVYRLNQLFRAKDAPFLDGAYIYTHYQSWLFRTTQDTLKSVIQRYFISSGYYEDELVMLEHGVRNFLRHDSHVITEKPRLVQDIPVFIIGSGPSLDRSIEVIKKYKGSALVFSCGTALGPLLANGIRPDFQCELENGAATFTVLSATRERHAGGFEGIRLIAASTVHPDVPPMFEEAFFFMREGVSSTQLFGHKYAPIPGVAPTCTNTAFAAATALGFRNIYLFGVDCGVRNEKAHHSKDSFYFKDEEARRSVKPKYDIVQRANFGGTVRTNWVLDLTRMMLEGLQSARGANLVNCSDGAQIANATPMVPRALKLSVEPLDKASIIAKLREETTALKAGALFREKTIEQVLKEFDAFHQQAGEFFSALGESLTDCFSLRDAVVDFLDEMEEKYKGITAVLDASARSLPKIGMFFIARIGDEKLRKVLLDGFRAGYEEIFFDMMRGTRKMLEELCEESRKYEAAHS